MFLNQFLFISLPLNVVTLLSSLVMEVLNVGNS